MAIQLRCFGEGGTGLIAVCDVCGRLIKESEDANVCWLAKSCDSGDVYRFNITCKDKCTRILDAIEGSQCTQELNLALFFLMNNSRVDYERTLRKVQELDALGMLGSAPEETP